jgi:hypothetical protein
VQRVLDATSSQLETLWPAAADSGVPIINLPGAAASQNEIVNAS